MKINSELIMPYGGRSFEITSDVIRNDHGGYRETIPLNSFIGLNKDDVIIPKSGWYVYILIDGSTGNAIYVGCGKGNRIFSHLNKSYGKSNKKIEFIESVGDNLMYFIYDVYNTKNNALYNESKLIEKFGIENLLNSIG